MMLLMARQPNLALGHQALTVTTTAASLAPSDRAVIAIATVETSPMRIRFDGAPASTTHHRVYPGQSFWILSELRLFQAILDSSTTTNGTLRVTYFGYR